MTNANLIANVVKASVAQSKSTVVVIDAIKACNVAWDDAKSVSPVADAYKQGRVMVALGVAQKEATRIIALKPHKDGAGDDARTFAQHQAVRAAISAWSNIRGLAGAPSAQTGGKRKPKVTKVAEKDNATAAPLAIIPAIVKAKSEADFRAYCLKMAQNISKALNINAKYATGDAGAWARETIANAMKLKD